MTSDSDSPGGPGTQTAHSAQTARVDHLVVVASNLEEGVVWCKRTLGITPGPGGQHPLMGTHNRLFRIATVNYPCAYFEIIAMDSSSQGLDKTRTSRWFDMDSEALQASVTADGPRLVHFVANTPDIVAAADALQTLGLDRGPVVAASRETPRGLLQWQITVRDDGQRLFQGGLPTLIQWGDVHPANGMAESGVTLQSLNVRHPGANLLQAAQRAIGLQGVGVQAGAPNLIATLRTPRGLVTLESKGI
jgi:hypothetical protein